MTRAPMTGVFPLTKGNRLVTITGSGGAGKTRIAQQVAAQVIDDHPDGTWWIELAPIDASQVRGTIAAAVSITEPDRLVERLDGRVLLVPISDWLKRRRMPRNWSLTQ